MRTYVEQMLPAQFLLDLGTYMQTVAHIELEVWRITMHAEGIDPRSVEEHPEYFKLKRNTRELLKRFRESADECPPPIAKRIREVSDEVACGLETRNFAAHGAFYWEDQNQGTQYAVHYFDRGKGKERKLPEVKKTVNHQQVEETIQVADQLLHSVNALHNAVIDWRYPDGIPKPTDLPPETDADIK